MNREQYEARRKDLMTDLENIMKAETVDQAAFDAKKKEVEELDAQWEQQIQNQASIAALNDNAPSVAPVVDLSGVRPEEPAMPTMNDVHGSMEYREAFMNYIMNRKPIPERFVNATTTTSDTGAVIPTTMVHEIIRELKVRGNVWNKVRKLNVQGGVEYPINDIIPTAHWVTEIAPSTDQKLGASTNVQFSYYMLECKIAQSLLTSVVTIAEFEALFTTLAVEAIIAALEKGVFAGTGSGQMKGILNETRIPAANTITMSAADVADWAKWKGKVFAAMKKAYRNGDFWMAQSTFDTLIDGMTDQQGQPIGRVNYGIDGNEIYRFGGKVVETVEDDVITPYSAAASGDIFAVFGDLNNYAVNTNMNMETVAWFDHDNNTKKNKVTMVLDGKVLDPNGFLIIKKA